MNMAWTVGGDLSWELADRCRSCLRRRRKASSRRSWSETIQTPWAFGETRTRGTMEVGSTKNHQTVDRKAARSEWLAISTTFEDTGPGSREQSQVTHLETRRMQREEAIVYGSDSATRFKTEQSIKKALTCHVI